MINSFIKTPFRIFLVMLLVAFCGVKSWAVEPFTVKVTGHGPPMILIPGLACGGDVWDGTVKHFQNQYECHVLTLAGFAGNPALANPFLDTVRAGIIKYIAEKHLDHPVIIGHSLGGSMVYWVGATAPGAVGPLIAVDGLPFLPEVMYPGATVETSKPYAEQIRTMYSGFTPEQFTAGTRSALATMITSPTNIESVLATSKKSNPNAVGEATYELMTTDLRPMLHKIKAPVLLIGATAAIPAANKAATEDRYRAQVAEIPRHKVVFAPHAKHFIQLDEPQFFYTQVETFLKENKPAK